MRFRGIRGTTQFQVPTGGKLGHCAQGAPLDGHVRMHVCQTRRCQHVTLDDSEAGRPLLRYGFSCLDIAAKDVGLN